MPRKVRDRNLDSREGRARLKPRGMPYYRSLDKKLHLGYRRLKGKAGTWWARHYIGAQNYEIESIGVADDLSEADGAEIMDFWQAQMKARECMAARSRSAAGETSRYTVDEAVDDYLKWLESEGRSKDAISDATYRAKAFIRPKLGDKEVAALTANDFRHWRDGVAKALPRVRTKPGEKQKHRPLVEDASAEEQGDEQRKRRASVNRIWTTLRAALNKAFENDKVPSDGAWRKVKPFKGTNKARVRYLELADAKRLVNASDADFRQLMQGGLLSGGRYGQLARLMVQVSTATPAPSE